MSYVDAHCHIWRLSRGDYHWMDQSAPFLAPIAKDFSLDDYRSVSKPYAPQKIVLVQAAATEAETEFLLAQAENDPLVGAVVGWVDLTKKNVIETIEQLKQHEKFRGIRPMLQDIEDTEWLLTVPKQSIWSQLVDMKLCFDALIQPRHLSLITDFCIKHPELNVVIDHAAKPQWADKSFDMDSYLNGMKKIGQETQACCKVSGLFTELSSAQYGSSEEYFVPLFEHLIEFFGPSRLMWGSDWPVVNLAANYSKWYEMSKTLLSQLSEADQNQIFYGTANRFYQIQGDS